MKRDMCILVKKNIKDEVVKHFKDFYKEQVTPSTSNQVRVATMFSRLVIEAEANALFFADKFGGINRSFRKSQS